MYTELNSEETKSSFTGRRASVAVLVGVLLVVAGVVAVVSTQNVSRHTSHIKSFVMGSPEQASTDLSVSMDNPYLTGTWEDNTVNNYCIYVRANTFGGLTFSPSSQVISDGHWYSGAGVVTGTTGFGYFLYSQQNGGQSLRVNMLHANPQQIHWANGVTWTKKWAPIGGCPGAALKPMNAPQVANDAVLLTGSWRDTSGFCFYVRQNADGGVVINPGAHSMSLGHWVSGAAYVQGTGGYAEFVHKNNGGYAYRLDIQTIANGFTVIHWANGVTWTQYSKNLVGCAGAI